MKIIINTIHGKAPLKIGPHWTVKRLKEEISKQYGADVDEQILRFNNEDLNNNEVLVSSLGINTESEIDLIFNLNEFDVVIQSESETINLNVKKDETTLDLKKKISEKLNKSLEEIVLIYRGFELPDNRKLRESKITEKSVISIILKVVNEKRKLLVFVNDDEKSHHIEYNKLIRGREVKQNILEKYGQYMMLTFKGKEIKDDEIIGNDSSNQAVLSLTAKTLQNSSKFEIQLNAKMSDNRTHAVRISTKEKCIELKRILHRVSGIPIDEQSITFNGLILKNDKLLEEYQLGNNSIVTLTPKLRGG